MDIVDNEFGAVLVSAADAAEEVSRYEALFAPGCIDKMDDCVRSGALKTARHAEKWLKGEKDNPRRLHTLVASSDSDSIDGYSSDEEESVEAGGGAAAAAAADTSEIKELMVVRVLAESLKQLPKSGKLKFKKGFFPEKEYAKAVDLLFLAAVRYDVLFYNLKNDLIADESITSTEKKARFFQAVGQFEESIHTACIHPAILLLKSHGNDEEANEAEQFVTSFHKVIHDVAMVTSSIEGAGER